MKLISRVFSAKVLCVLTLTCALVQCERLAQDESSQVSGYKDPIDQEMYAFHLKVRQLYNNRQFDELEKMIKELRVSKETFGNGSWKVVQFYAAFDLREEEAESMWQLHDQIHQDWLEKHPASMAAHTSFIDFLTSYAWQARGSGYVDTVTEKGWKLFEERLNRAVILVKEARKLNEKDPAFYNAALAVALGQGWPAESYQALLNEAHRNEPLFWGYEPARAYSLLPRWYGEPGDWETYAENAIKREGGLGAESYARIILKLNSFYDNIFNESRADWRTTKEGLNQLRTKYPQSMYILSEAAQLAVFAQDKEYAKALFAEIGERNYLPVWRKTERFIQARNWANAVTP